MPAPRRQTCFHSALIFAMLAAMWRRHHMRLLVIATGVVVAVVILIASLSREPTYKGLTIREWLKRSPGANNVDGPTREALIILGTNNFPLLLRSVEYDPGKDKIMR